MIKMIATTISNSIRENPFCFFKTQHLIVGFESESGLLILRLSYPTSEQAWFQS
jgi:hypothetical protein